MAEGGEPSTEYSPPPSVVTSSETTTAQETEMETMKQRSKMLISHYFLDRHAAETTTTVK